MACGLPSSHLVTSSLGATWQVRAQLDTLSNDRPMRARHGRDHDEDGESDDGAGVGLGSRSAPSGGSSSGAGGSSSQPWGGAGGDACLLSAPRSAAAHGATSSAVAAARARGRHDDDDDGGSTVGSDGDDDDDDDDDDEDDKELPEWVKRVTGLGGAPVEKNGGGGKGGGDKGGGGKGGGSTSGATPRSPARAGAAGKGDSGALPSPGRPPAWRTGDEASSKVSVEVDPAAAAAAARRERNARREREEEAEREMMKRLELEAFKSSEMRAEIERNARRKPPPSVGAPVTSVGAPPPPMMSPSTPEHEERMRSLHEGGTRGDEAMVSMRERISPSKARAAEGAFTAAAEGAFTADASAAARAKAAAHPGGGGLGSVVDEQMRMLQQWKASQPGTAPPPPPPLLDARSNGTPDEPAARATVVLTAKRSLAPPRPPLAEAHSPAPVPSRPSLEPLDESRELYATPPPALRDAQGSGSYNDVMGSGGVYGCGAMTSCSSPSGWSVGTSRWSERGGGRPSAFAAAAAAAARVDEGSIADDLQSQFGGGSIAASSMAGGMAAEERIAAAAAAAAGAVVASECIKWRARSERLEAERKGQVVLQTEMHLKLREREREYRAAEEELYALRDELASSGAAAMSRQRTEIVTLKENLHKERQETAAAEEALSTARREISELEIAIRDGEGSIEAMHAQVLPPSALQALQVRGEQAAGGCKEIARELAVAEARLEEKRAAARRRDATGVHAKDEEAARRIEWLRGEVARAEGALPERHADADALSQASGHSASEASCAHMSAAASTAAEMEEEEEEERAGLDSLRRQLADTRRARRESESRRCVSRHAAWHAAWSVLSAAAIQKADSATYASLYDPVEEVAAGELVADDTVSVGGSDVIVRAPLRSVAQSVQKLEQTASPPEGEGGAGVESLPPTPDTPREGGFSGGFGGGDDDEEARWVTVASEGGDDAWLDEEEFGNGGDEEETVEERAPTVRTATAAPTVRTAITASGHPPAALAAPVAAKRSPIEVVESAWAAAEVLAAEVIAKARVEVDDEAATPPVEDERHGTADGGGGSGGDAALDWAAARERDAFEAAGRRHGAYDDALEPTADAVRATWQELARDEAQHLLHLNEEGTKVEAAWQAEKAHFLQLKAEVQEELRREQRQAMMRARQPGGSGAADDLGDADDEQLRAELAEQLPKVRQAQVKARNLRRERSALESEFARRQEAISALETKVRRLREVL